MSLVQLHLCPAGHASLPDDGGLQLSPRGQVRRHPEGKGTEKGSADTGHINPLVPKRYYCTYTLVFFLRSICRQKLTQTLLTHKCPKPTIVSIKITISFTN